MVPLELTVVVIWLYENVVAKLKTTKGWSKEIKCNIDVMQRCPLSHTLFGIYIDELKEWLEATGCNGPKLASMVITLLLYVDDIFLLTKIHHDLDKQHKILHDHCSRMGMTINTDKTKVMIVKSKKINHDNFIYDNNYLDKFSSYKYLGIDINHQLNWNCNIEKKIIWGWKTYYELENNCKSIDL